MLMTLTCIASLVFFGVWARRAYKAKKAENEAAWSLRPYGGIFTNERRPRFLGWFF